MEAILLTEKQRDLLEFIIAGFELGKPPTLAEMVDHAGLRSSNSIVHRMNSLARKGFLKRERGHRSVVPLKWPDGRPYRSLTDRSAAFLETMKKELGASHHLVERYRQEVLGDEAK